MEERKEMGRSLVGQPMGLRAVARAVVVSDAGELLLCRGAGGQYWVPPGGTLDPGETLPVAAAREALEEAGIRVVVGRLLYMEEFRKGGVPEHVLTVAFLARPLEDRPDAAEEAAGRVRPAGGPDRPWARWIIQDADGPVREVGWFSKAEVQRLREPVYPAFLRDRFWEMAREGADPYLGLIED